MRQFFPGEEIQMRNLASTTYLQVIRVENTQHGKQPAARADLRFGTGPDDLVSLLNKADGVIRVLIP